MLRRTLRKQRRDQRRDAGRDGWADHSVTLGCGELFVAIGLRVYIDIHAITTGSNIDLAVADACLAIHAISLVEFARELRVGEVRPTILIEAGGAFELLFGNVQNEKCLVRVVGIPPAGERFVWHRKHLVAKSQEAAVGDCHVTHFAGIGIQYDIVDFTDAFTTFVLNVHSDQFAGADVRARRFAIELSSQRSVSMFLSWCPLGVRATRDQHCASDSSKSQSNS